MEINEIRSAIETGIPGSQVVVDGDGSHYSAIVVSKEFAGKSMVQQHQLVYKTLGDKVGTDIHALAIRTFTPEEWESAQQPRNTQE
jgi:acid stress-induced BolA-like protein IbaG/YrbA